MRFSQLFVQTLRDVPNDAEVVSHQLLARAGYIVKLASGIYSYTPLMWRVLQNILTIVREELAKAGAQELLLPILQPNELWEESGRAGKLGDSEFRLKDRNERPMLLGPTHEEVITSLARATFRSYKQLPQHLYQIQNKFRDEPRPRFGLLRGREFIMQDGYSFHTSQEDLEREYAVIAEAYYRIFERCGLKTVMVESDSGAIGGSVSHEFMWLTGHQSDEQQSGENDVVFTEETNEQGRPLYAANIEKAEAIPQPLSVDGAEAFAQYAGPTEIDTPEVDSIEKLSGFLNCQPEHICKTLVYVADDVLLTAVLLRGDYEVEELKLQAALRCSSLRMATDAELAEFFTTKKGFVGFYETLCTNQTETEGPLTLCEWKNGQHPTLLNTAKNKHIVVLADESVLGLKNFVIANNQVDKHHVNANWQRLQGFRVVDVRRVKAGDLDKTTQTPLKMTRGIEVGNIFQLGTKYSKPMKAQFMDEQGKERPLVMGTYGLGITRLASTVVEASHDECGIVWPKSLAPYQVVLVVANVKDEQQNQLGEHLYQQCQEAGIDVLLDDRNERAGVKFKDAELLGFPMRVTIGKKAVEGLVEVKPRAGGDQHDLPADQLVEWLKNPA